MVIEIDEKEMKTIERVLKRGYYSMSDYMELTCILVKQYQAAKERMIKGHDN